MLLDTVKLQGRFRSWFFIRSYFHFLTLVSCKISLLSIYLSKIHITSVPLVSHLYPHLSIFNSLDVPHLSFLSSPFRLPLLSSLLLPASFPSPSSLSLINAFLHLSVLSLSFRSPRHFHSHSLFRCILVRAFPLPQEPERGQQQSVDQDTLARTHPHRPRVPHVGHQLDSHWQGTQNQKMCLLEKFHP